MSGRMAQIAASPSPYWATTPGRKFSMNTSALPASARTASAPSQVRMSTARERLPALSAAKPTRVTPASLRPRPAGALHVTACGRFYLDDFGPPTAPDREKRAARRSHATCRSRAVLRVVFPCLQPPLTPASLTSSAHLRFSPRTKAAQACGLALAL